MDLSHMGLDGLGRGDGDERRAGLVEMGIGGAEDVERADQVSDSAIVWEIFAIDAGRLMEGLI